MHLRQPSPCGRRRLPWNRRRDRRFEHSFLGYPRLDQIRQEYRPRIRLLQRQNYEQRP